MSRDGSLTSRWPRKWDMRRLSNGEHKSRHLAQRGARSHTGLAPVAGHRIGRRRIQNERIELCPNIDAN
jgi:hypothetical protein